VYGLSRSSYALGIVLSKGFVKFGGKPWLIAAVNNEDPAVAGGLLQINWFDNQCLKELTFFTFSTRKISFYFNISGR
jgi:hypothetical protein